MGALSVSRGTPSVPKPRSILYTFDPSSFRDELSAEFPGALALSNGRVLEEGRLCAIRAAIAYGLHSPELVPASAPSTPPPHTHTHRPHSPSTQEGTELDPPIGIHPALVATIGRSATSSSSFPKALRPDRIRSDFHKLTSRVSTSTNGRSVRSPDSPMSSLWGILRRRRSVRQIRQFPHYFRVSVTPIGSDVVGGNLAFAGSISHHMRFPVGCISFFPAIALRTRKRDVFRMAIIAS